MRIAFGDLLDLDYTPETPYRAPLGGAQSAACYLAAALAADGHDVHYACHSTTPGIYRGVRCVSWRDFTFERMRALSPDAFIILHGPGPERRLRQELPGTRLILWTGHADDQPAVAPLADPGVCGAYDGIALVSEWQRRQFLARFPLDPARAGVLRNAVAPAFAGLFAPDEEVLTAKSMPPVLAYTSTPFRGLHLLPGIFPRIRQRVPGARLRIYSGMGVYGMSRADDEAQFGGLYRELRRMEGVEMTGSLPQPELAARLREAAVLAYPNTFAETSCIAVMEAMAAGCQVVTSRLGALEETGAGFAHLVATSDDETYVERFVERAAAALADLSSGMAGRLRAQVDFARAHYTWRARAREWPQWIAGLHGGERASRTG